MKFTKMQGAGNDYVYIDAARKIIVDPSALAVKISDRHFGVGGDGLILIHPSAHADVRMQMFNADGSEAEMCGNGIRCVAKYAYDHDLSKSNPMKIETRRGILSLSLQIEGGKVHAVTVDMQEPILDLPIIPANPEMLQKTSSPHEYDFVIKNGRTIRAAFASMGNPHAMIFVEDVAAVDLNEIGPMIENHPAFPNRINANFVQVISRGQLKIRTWERGSGITLACGTGACASAVAAAITGRAERQVLANLPGGDLSLNWSRDNNHVYMTGPAVEVFSGEWHHE